MSQAVPKAHLFQIEERVNGVRRIILLDVDSEKRENITLLVAELIK